MAVLVGRGRRKPPIPTPLSAAATMPRISQRLGSFGVCGPVQTNLNPALLARPFPGDSYRLALAGKISNEAVGACGSAVGQLWVAGGGLGLPLGSAIFTPLSWPVQARAKVRPGRCVFQKLRRDVRKRPAPS